MCIGGGGGMPAPPPPPPAPVPAPMAADNGVQNAASDAKKKAAAAVGASQMNATGPQGLTTPADTTGTGKSLLGG
ncbi:hypothetical protein [Paramagnetospirillum kuznetsovii]|uniref:hypothetical protein n=1 Tax=Paramagnetospirillum kuznetsovii TaxID=2053833 RepID=UPI0011BE9D14|nr:hypothetical protein [Paramagnetospirillum kuznetsovii]